jgi:dihydrofolate reductase
MRVSLVVAVSENDVIGKNNALPWRLSEDLKRFKAVTMGKPIVMGRKTYDSIGKPLPGRLNIVVSRQAGLAIAGCVVKDSLRAALDAVRDASEVCVIGGAEIYRQALPLADVIYLTRVHAKIEGDSYFPKLSVQEWREEFREGHVADERHAYPFSFITLRRAGVIERR